MTAKRNPIEVLSQLFQDAKINEEDSLQYAQKLVDNGCDDVTYLQRLNESSLKELGIVKKFHIETILSLSAAKSPSVGGIAKSPSAGIARYDFFISHVKIETCHEATLIHDHYKDSRFKVFLDQEQSFALTKLKEIAANTKVLIVLISSSYWSRPFCVTEIVQAHKSGAELYAINIFNPAGFNYESYNRDLREKGLDFVRSLMDEGAWKTLSEMSIFPEDVKSALQWFLEFKGPEYHPRGLVGVRAAELEHILKSLENVFPSPPGAALAESKEATSISTTQQRLASLPPLKAEFRAYFYASHFCTKELECWDHCRVEKVVKAFRDAGKEVWFHPKKFASATDATVFGVQQSGVFVAFTSKDYDKTVEIGPRHSKHTECCFEFDEGTGERKTLIVTMSPSLKGKTKIGGQDVSDKSHLDFTSDDKLDSCIQGIIDFLYKTNKEFPFMG